MGVKIQLQSGNIKEQNLTVIQSLIFGAEKAKVEILLSQLFHKKNHFYLSFKPSSQNLNIVTNTYEYNIFVQLIPLNSNMLLSDIKIIKLQNAAPKILCLSTAYNNTFVMVRVDKPCQGQSIVHFDADGKILWQQKYISMIDTFGQMNQKEVIVLNVSQSKIDILNLEMKSIRSVHHSYLFGFTAYMKIYNFPQTRAFCVQEKGTYNQPRLKLSYYSYDLLQENSKPLAVYLSDQDEWNYLDFTIFKGNNHSKIIWSTHTCQSWAQQISFNYYELRENAQGDIQGSFNRVNAINTLGEEYGINNLSLNFYGIWETKKNEYLLWTTSNKRQYKAQKNGVINNNYILNTDLGDDKGVVRETKFVFDKVNEEFSWNDQLVDCFGAGNISVFHTYRHNKGKSFQTPVYYVNNLTEEIVHKQTWQCSCYNSNYYLPGWDGNAFVRSQFQNADVSEIRVIVSKIADPKQISLHLLLNLNEDFDDDLLQDAIELLHHP